MKKIPDNLNCLCEDDLLEYHVNQVFECDECGKVFATEREVRFPSFCPACGAKYEWKEKS